MSKLTLAPLTSGYRSAESMNVNYAAIVAAIENTLSRDGTGPNEMGANLDMDSNRILNLPYPDDPTEPVRLIDLDNLADVTVSLGDGVTMVEAASVVFPVIQTTIRVVGNREVGDGADALFTRVAEEPDHLGKFQDGEDQWWEYSDEVVKAAAFGAYSSLNVDQQPAIQSAIDFMLSREFTAEVVLPRGSMRLNSPVMVEPQDSATSARNVRIRGHGGYNATTGTLPGTRLYYYGSDDMGGFQIVSGYLVTLEDITFRGQVNNHKCMVNVYAADDPAFSGVGVEFIRCHFSPGTGVHFTEGQVWVADSKTTTMTNCIITVGNGVERTSLGVRWGNSSGDRNTLQDGVVASFVMDRCYVQADVGIENVSMGRITSCTFGEMGDAPNTTTSRGAAIVAVGDKRCTNLIVENCYFPDEDATVPAITQPDYQKTPSMTSSSEDAAGLIVVGCIFRDRSVGVKVTRGWVHFGPNSWFMRVTGAKAIVIDSTCIGPVTGLRNQDFAQNFRNDLVCVEDNRASMEFYPMLVNRELASSPLVLSTLNVEQDALAATGIAVPGGRTMWRATTVVSNTGVDAAEVRVHNAYGSTSINNTQRVIIPAGGIHTFSSCWVENIPYNDSVTIRTRIEQVSGSTMCRVLTGASGRTKLQVEVWDG